MEINEFLQWVVGSGGAVIIGSWIAERVPWFQMLPAEKKEYSFFGFVSLIWVAVYLGISGLFVVVILGKLFHKADKV